MTPPHTEGLKERAYIAVYSFLYRTIMRIAHRYNWHYAPPIYPEGDTHLWCQWCGFRQTIKYAPKSESVSGVGEISSALKSRAALGEKA